MNHRSVASCVLALCLAVPVPSSATSPEAIRFEVGALAVERLGQGPPVLLIPGLASGSWVWRDTAPRLAERHAVYLVTLPGFDGRVPVAGTTLESLRADLLALLEREKLREAALVGHSIGGTLSLAFAAEHPDRVSGVVSVDGLPVFPGTERAPDRKALAEAIRAQIGSQSREQFVAYNLAYMRTIGCLEEAVAAELAALTARSDVGATADFAAQVMALDLRPKLSAIQAPVTVISPFHAPDFQGWGLDEAGKTDYYRQLLPGIKRLEVVSIAPARHFLMFDQPGKFAEALDRALASLPETRSARPPRSDVGER